MLIAEESVGLLCTSSAVGSSGCERASSSWTVKVWPAFTVSGSCSGSAATIFGGAIRNLPDYHVVIKTIPFRQAYRQEFEQCRNIEAAQQPDYGCCLTGLPGA